VLVKRDFFPLNAALAIAILHRHVTVVKFQRGFRCCQDLNNTD
jgi:hypothetical protein